jgi:hypothetical protein
MSFRSLFISTLAILSLSDLPASAETVGTGCAAQGSGEIYRFAPYRSAPSGSCGSGDQKIRVRLDQPDTAFVKRSGFSTEMIGNGEAPGELHRFEIDLAVRIGAADAGGCALVVEDLSADQYYTIAVVPLEQWQHGIRQQSGIDVDENPIGTFQTDGLVITDSHGAILFHDVFIDARGGKCFAAALMEWANNVSEFFAQ